MSRTSLLLQPGNESEPHRIPMGDTEILRFPFGLAFPVCPGCGITLEREYQRYCDRCGQSLSWKRFSRATVVLWSGRDSRQAMLGSVQPATLSGENDTTGVVSEPPEQSVGEAIVAQNHVPLGEVRI